MSVAEERVAVPWVALGALGVVTIVGYGACYYAYGVLIEPIAHDTGWSRGALGAVFSIALAVMGVCGLIGGRVLDRVGTRPIFIAAAALGSALTAVASFQTSIWAFAAAYGVGCGVVGGLAFYGVTQPTAAKLMPRAPAKAIIWLTIAGAFASPLYLPLTAELVTRIGWRDTIRVHAVTVAVVLLAASRIVAVPRARPVGSSPRTRDVVSSAWRSPSMRVWLVAAMIGGAATDVMLVYQVPAMVAAGLSLATASALAGLRGFAQLAGRLPLERVLARLGARRTLIVTYVTGAVAVVVLCLSGDIVLALIYSVLAGASVGAIGALEGIYTHELVDQRHLGVLFGVQQAVFSLGGAVGPAIAGLALDRTGSFASVAVLGSVGFLVSAWLLRVRGGGIESRAADTSPAPSS